MGGGQRFLQILFVLTFTVTMATAADTVLPMSHTLSAGAAVPFITFTSYVEGLIALCALVLIPLSVAALRHRVLWRTVMRRQRSRP